MSLEATIQENTNAIRELIAAIKTGVPTTAAQVAAVVTESKPTEKEPAAETASSAEKTEPAASTQPTVEAAAETAAQEKKAEPTGQAAPTRQNAADAVTKLARLKGRNAAVNALAKFDGATNLSDLKPEQYADLIAECTAACDAAAIEA